MSVEKAKQLFQSGQVALKVGDLEEALDQAKAGLDICDVAESEVHAALLDLQASVETEIKKKERSRAASRASYTQLKALSFDSHSAKKFAEANARPSLRLQLDPTSDNIGPHSKVGGNPVVPKDFVWPKREDGRPLTFLCQINLAEVNDFVFTHKYLPRAGILSFFYDVEEEPSGLDAGDRHGWCVYYFAPQIKVYHYDEAEGEVIAGYQVHYVVEPSYPDPVSKLAEQLERKDFGEYDNFTDTCYAEMPYHRLLGHPQLVLNDFFEECEIASRGLELQSVLDDPYLAKDISQACKSWVLLLQLDSDERVNFMWGEGGTIYFCIEEEALKHKDFSNVWLIMQCT